MVKPLIHHSNKSEYFLIFIGIIFFYTGLLLNALRSQAELFAIARLLMAITFFTAYFSCLIKNKFPIFSRPFLKKYHFLLFYVSLLTFPNLLRFYWVQGLRVAAANEFAYFSMFAFGLFIMTCSYEQIVKLMKFLFLTNYIIFLLFIPYMDARFSIETEHRRAALDAAFEEAGGRGIYNAQMSMLHLFSTYFLAVFAFKIGPIMKTLAISSLGFIVITGIYYQKRATLFEFATIIILFLFIHGNISRVFNGIKKIQFIAFTLLGALATGLAMQFYGRDSFQLISRVLFRFQEIQSLDHISDFARIREVIIWFQTALPYQRIFGGGPLGFHVSGATGNVTRGMHIGWGRFFVTGGPVLVWYIASTLFLNFKYALRYRGRLSSVIGLSLPLYFGLNLFHSSIVGTNPAGFAFMFAMFLYPALFHFEKHGMSPVLIK